MIAAQNPAEVYLTDLSPKDKPWDKHQAEAAQVQKLYQGSEFSRYADRINDCSKRLQFALLHEDNGVVFKLHAARFCRVRHCPVCQWRRSSMWRGRFFDALPKILSDHPQVVPIFITITQRNCPLDELRSQITAMGKAWHRLTQRKAWPAVGWIKSLEVTKGKDGLAHPHYHALLLVNPGYFSGQGYVSQKRWCELWQSVMKLEYLPSVNVKRVKPQPNTEDKSGIVTGILETLKYSVKPEDVMNDAEWLYGVTRELHKTRAVATGGIVKDYLRQTEPQDLIHDEKLAAAELDELAAAPQIIFDWMATVKRYAKLNSDSGTSST